jgi:hypothetical protein
MIGDGPQMGMACWAVNGMGHSTARQPLQALLGYGLNLGGIQGADGRIGNNCWIGRAVDWVGYAGEDQSMIFRG